jgi:hypothetical protein
MNNPAIILRHTSAPQPVLHDPREQSVSEDAKDALALSSGPHFDMPNPDEWDQLEALQGLSNLMAKYGAKRVNRWCRMLASINGEEV